MKRIRVAGAGQPLVRHEGLVESRGGAVEEAIMSDAAAVVRDYEIKSDGPIALGESCEVRVVMERRCRTVRLSFEDGYAFSVEELWFGGREVVRPRKPDDIAIRLAAFGWGNERPTEIPPGGEVRIRVQRVLDVVGPFRAVLKVVEAEDVWSQAAWKAAAEEERREWGSEWQLDFGPSRDLIAPGETVEMTVDMGDRFEWNGRWCEVATKFDPSKILRTGHSENGKVCPVEVTFTFKRYVRGDRLRLVAKNVGEYPARVYATVFGGVPAGAWTGPAK